MDLEGAVSSLPDTVQDLMPRIQDVSGAPEVRCVSIPLQHGPKSVDVHLIHLFCLVVAVGPAHSQQLSSWCGAASSH